MVRAVPGGRDPRHLGRVMAHALADAVAYQLEVATFSRAGTVAAATDRIAHLADLGITHVALLSASALGASDHLAFVERGPFALLVNESDRSADAPNGEVILSSRPQRYAHTLPPRSCMLVRQR